MRTIVGAGLAVLLVALAPACGGSNEGYLSTATVRTALREAGFSNLRVASQKRLAKQLARRQRGNLPPGFSVENVPDQDTIFAPPLHSGLPTLMATRMESNRIAKATFERVYNSETIERDLAQARKEGALPKGFARDKLRVARVCNVIMQLYNADRDPRITAGFSRGVRLLRAKC